MASTILVRRNGGRVPKRGYSADPVLASALDFYLGDDFTRKRKKEANLPYKLAPIKRQVRSCGSAKCSDLDLKPTEVPNEFRRKGPSSDIVEEKAPVPMIWTASKQETVAQDLVQTPASAQGINNGIGTKVLISAATDLVCGTNTVSAVHLKASPLRTQAHSSQVVPSSRNYEPQVDHTNQDFKEGPPVSASDEESCSPDRKASLSSRRSAHPPPQQWGDIPALAQGTNNASNTKVLISAITHLVCGTNTVNAVHLKAFPLQAEAEAHLSQVVLSSRNYEPQVGHTNQDLKEELPVSASNEESSCSPDGKASLSSRRSAHPPPEQWGGTETLNHEETTPQTKIVQPCVMSIPEEQTLRSKWMGSIRTWTFPSEKKGNKRSKLLFGSNKGSHSSGWLGIRTLQVLDGSNVSSWFCSPPSVSRSYISGKSLSHAQPTGAPCEKENTASPCHQRPVAGCPLPLAVEDEETESLENKLLGSAPEAMYDRTESLESLENKLLGSVPEQCTIRSIESLEKTAEAAGTRSSNA